MSSPSHLQTYLWEGLNAKGEREKGEVMAANPALAQMDLKKHSIDAYKIKLKPNTFFSLHLGKRKKKITPLDILLFTRQLATMLTAGLPMAKAFDIVGKGHENPSMEELILTMNSSISAGNTLAETLAKYPKYFDNLYCSLIDAGERSGTLDIMLNRIATYLEKTQTLKKKIKKAAMYPLVVFSATFAAAGILLIFVVPRFQSMFNSFGADLPTFTQWVVNLSHFLQQYWWLVFGSLFALIWGFIEARRRFAKFAYQVDKYILRLPIFGIITQKAIIARFTRTLATTLAAGMPIVDAMACVNNVIDNRVYKDAVAYIRNDISSGQQMSTTIEKTQLFPNLVTKMVAVGEESGALEDMLNKVAAYFEEDVDSLVDNLSALLEPLIMIVLGVIIGSFVIAMYLPIFRLGSVL